MINVSHGNSKIGNIPNISLPPGLSCPPGVPCAKLCYARKSYPWPNVARAWDENWAEWKRDPIFYFEQLDAWIGKRKPKRFRFHVSGDIPHEAYFKSMESLALRNPTTLFMSYTKTTFGPSTVSNFTLLRSTWPGWFYTDEKELPLAVFVPKGLQHPWCDGDPQTMTCPGSCRFCSACWTARPGDVILFHQH
jgi:hypothetical protein